MPYTINEVLEFLKNPKSRKEMEEKFGLSNSESWHLLNWLTKGNYIDDLGRIPVAGQPNRMKLYKAKKH